MSGPLEIEWSYPLAWPAGRPRTADPKPALFRDGGRRLTPFRATQRLRKSLDALTRYGTPYRTTGIILSSNIRGGGARDRREPDDSGVALALHLDGRPHVLACDRWDAVADNIAAIAAHIDALRGQERWGVADLAQAFAGHAALPPPGGAAPETCWQVLNLPPAHRTRDDVADAYRQLVVRWHPDRPGGDRGRMAEINAARDAAMKLIAEGQA